MCRFVFILASISKRSEVANPQALIFDRIYQDNQPVAMSLLLKPALFHQSSNQCVRD